jgi:transcriptional regulator with XRE-family HTH domain
MALREYLEKHRYDEDFVYEQLIYDVVTNIAELMRKKGVTRKQLANKMGVKPSYITKILGGSNISFKTLAKVLAALKADVAIQFVSTADREVWSEKPAAFVAEIPSTERFYRETEEISLAAA